MGGDVEGRKGNRSLSLLKPEAPQGVLTCSNPGKTSPSLVITALLFTCLGSRPVSAAGLKCMHSSLLIFQSHYLADYFERCRKLMSDLKHQHQKRKSQPVESLLSLTFVLSL